MYLASIESIWCKQINVVTVTKLQNKERRQSFSLYLQLRLYLSFSACVFPEPYGGKQSGWERPVCLCQSWAQPCHFPHSAELNRLSLTACPPPGGRRRAEWGVRALDSHDGASVGTSIDYAGAYHLLMDGKVGNHKMGTIRWRCNGNNGVQLGLQ